MIDLLLDPYIVSVPHHLPPYEARRLVQRAIVWSKGARENGCRLVVAYKYLTSLWEEQQYPIGDRISEICRLANEEEYKFNSQTIFQVFRGILDMAPKVEDLLQIDDVLLDDAKTSILPEFIRHRLSPSVASALLETIATCAAHNASTGAAYPSAVASEGDDEECGGKLVAAFYLVELECKSTLSISCPSQISIQCPLLDEPDEIFASLDFANIKDDLALAIKWCWARAIPRHERSAHPLREYSVRDEFRERIQCLNVDTTKQLCRKIAYLLCGKRTAGLEIEALRIDRGGSSPQRVRPTDDARAFRMQISQHGPGYHVHYWQASHGAIELAWMGTENDFYIPE